MSETHAPFFKMNGIGNKIIVADMRGRADRVTPEAAIALAGDEATHFDQLMAVYSPLNPNRDADIEIFNADGSTAGACGNGTRCVVSWLAGETGATGFKFKISGAIIDAQIGEDGMISVNMGVPRFEWDQIPLAEEFYDTRNIELQIGPIDNPILHTPSVMSIGNPHAVFWVKEDVNSYALDRFGPLLENHPIFPDRANITLAQVTGENELTIRTWERGTGLTLACGSGACAAAVNAARTGRTGRVVKVRNPGGDLIIEWREDNFVIMTGGAKHEFSGTFNPATGAWEQAA
ncbi:diaminopimelate epimerase [Pseudahrensia aquimaris]|uniref:Diaminopimelate epimerase n=1 Tax=Pseudahrensia aquimaris TaxID=744461 RepID=A0ABW3FB12_9HYPH